MTGLSALVCLVLTQVSGIQVSTLSGDQHQGTLETFNETSVVIKSEGQSVSIPVAELLVIRTLVQPTAPPVDSPIEVRLVDMSRLRVKSFATSGAATSGSTKSPSTMAILNHARLGELQIPISTIASVRLAAMDSKVETEWNQLLDRPLKKDAIAVRKGDVLDHLDGVIGNLNEAKIQFQMDGEDIEVKREKVFGMIYAKRTSLAKKSIAQLDLMSGDRLSLKQIAWDGTKWKARLVTGYELDIAPELFQTLDFSLGKVTYLSDLEPRSVKYTPYFDLPSSFLVNEYRRDKNFDGNRISLGERSYVKGLAIHSQTQLKYRLGGEYRRFQAIMGIGDEVPVGDVDVIVKGDNNILFKGSAKASEAGEKGTIRRAVPQHLDIDVTGVVELEIFVDFGSDKRDIGDRLYLANARAIR